MLRLLLALFQTVALLCGAGLAAAQDLQPLPALTARVTDLTATLSADERSRLDTKLAAFERGKGVQIAVLLVPTVQPETIEQYALRVAEAWRLGRKGVDDGALLLAAKQDRKLRIEVGYGLEGALTDAASKRIVSEAIAPRFKQGDFYGGLDAGVDAMMRVIDREPLPPPRQARAAAPAALGDTIDTLLPVFLVLVFVVGGILRAIFGRFLGAGIIGAVAGGIAWLLVSSLLIGGVVALIAFVVSLFAGLSGRGWSSGGGWPSGGSSWGGGGFSGGGGGFGGGGASGDW
ncbi:MAG: TPM domain-containing protein [Rhodocyclales bacterium]|nr:TPM domain-containing protein [Rhodocyclales bacterium]